MLTPPPHGMYLQAQAKAEELERQATLERLLRQAGGEANFRYRLARLLTTLATWLEPEVQQQGSPGRT